MTPGKSMQVNLKNCKPIKKIVRLVSVTCVALAIHGCSSVEETIDKEQAMTPEQQQLFILEKIESWSAAEPDIQRVLSLEADMQLIINQLASMSELDNDPLGDDKESENAKNMETNQNPAELPVNTDLSKAKANSNDLETVESIDSINNQQLAGIAPKTSSTIKVDSNDVEEVAGTDTINNQQREYPSHKVSNNTKISSKSMGHNFPKVGIHIAMFKGVNSIPIGWKYLQSILPASIVNKKPLLAKVNYEGSEYYSLRVGPFKSANSAKRTCLNLQQQQHYCSVVEYKGFSFN
jgi:hypothetical protein